MYTYIWAKGVKTRTRVPGKNRVTLIFFSFFHSYFRISPTCLATLLALKIQRDHVDQDGGAKKEGRIKGGKACEKCCFCFLPTKKEKVGWRNSSLHSSIHFHDVFGCPCPAEVPSEWSSPSLGYGYHLWSLYSVSTAISDVRLSLFLPLLPAV